MNALPCNGCKKAPVLHKADVISDGMCYYYHCSCGATGPWRRTPDDAAKLWNEWHGKKKAQPTHAAMVLAHKKGELAYAG